MNTFYWLVMNTLYWLLIVLPIGSALLLVVLVSLALFIDLIARKNP